MTKTHTKWCNGPIGFWCLNADIDEDKIIFQLDEFAEKGFMGIVAHPRHGLEVPYLSMRACSTPTGLCRANAISAMAQ